MSEIEETTDSVNMVVNDIQIIDISIEETYPLTQLSEEQLKKSFKISKKAVSWIQQILDIISQRNTFKIDEFSIVGAFYETLKEIDDEITGDSLQGLLNILQTSCNRGKFKLNELIMISNLYSSIYKVINNV